MTRAEEIRRAFDLAFASPAERAEVTTVALLAVRVGGAPYAVRLSELSAVAAKPRIAALPGGPPELAGLVSFRGGLLPVWDLAALLGHPGGALDG
ncbi:MAG: chemotaxis protein CheW, partial [Candidatus Eremiobacterota bacterium]